MDCVLQASDKRKWLFAWVKSQVWSFFLSINRSISQGETRKMYMPSICTWYYMFCVVRSYPNNLFIRAACMSERDKLVTQMFYYMEKILCMFWLVLGQSGSRIIVNDHFTKLIPVQNACGCINQCVFDKASDRIWWCGIASYGKIHICHILRAFPHNLRKLSKIID